MSTQEIRTTSARLDHLNTLEVLHTDTKDVSQLSLQGATSDDNSETQIEISDRDSEEFAREIFTEESVEGLLAGDGYERVQRFCERHNVTTTQALLAAFHAFLVRCTEEEGKKTYTIHECPQATFGEDFLLEISNDICESFDVLVQNVKSLGHRRLGSMASPGNCRLLYA